MHNELLEKHKNDPVWAEIVRLYSGLFDSENFRQDFILKLADTNLLLAAECSTISITKELSVENYIVNKAINSYQNDFNAEDSFNTFYTLIELDRINEIIPMISNERYRSYFKNTIIRAILNNDFNRIKDFSKIVSDIKDGEFALFIILNVTKQIINIGENNFSGIKSSFKDLIDVLNSEKNSNSIRLIKLARFLNMGIQRIVKILSKISNQKIDTNPNTKIAPQLLFQLLYDYVVPKISSTMENDLKSNTKNTLLSENHIVREEKWQKSHRPPKTSSTMENDLKSNLEKKLRKKLRKKEIKKERKKIKKERLSENQIVKKGKIVNCKVLKIFPSTVFVEIEGESRTASISIEELTDKRLATIDDFEYIGEKLHIGQTLVAKVIDIYEKYSVELSIKRI